LSRTDGGAIMGNRYLTVMMIVIIGLVSPNLLLAEDEVFNASQTSASMMIKYAEKSMKASSAEDAVQAELKFVVLYDVYIKAKSYALLNKVFFWFSVIAALAVLLWPSLSIVFKAKLDKWEWLKSATVQTTVTAIAALLFMFYSQYKDKQTNAETLMRHIMFSDKPAHELSLRVADELSKIDRGFSFNSVLGVEGADNKKTITNKTDD